MEEKVGVVLLIEKEEGGGGGGGGGAGNVLNWTVIRVLVKTLMSIVKEMKNYVINSIKQYLF